MRIDPFFLLEASFTPLESQSALNNFPICLVVLILHYMATSFSIGCNNIRSSKTKYPTIPVFMPSGYPDDFTVQLKGVFWLLFVILISFINI